MGLLLLPLLYLAQTIAMHVDNQALNRVARQAVSTCTNGYENVQASTMCMTDSPKYIAETAGVSDADKALILSKHNAYRAAMDRPASKMPKLYWDDELARLAEKWAKHCFVGHERDDQKSSFIPAYGMGPGQNAAFGHPTWDSAVTKWFNESFAFKYGQDYKIYIGPKGLNKIGHYTQIVQDTAFLIGCGYAKCFGGWGHFHICDYLEAQSDAIHPYTEGSSCDTCPDKCNNKLCDCGGKYCFNYGTLDLNTCQCTCKPEYTGDTCLEEVCPGLKCQNDAQINTTTCGCDCTPLYTGEFCKTKDCPEKDSSYCGADWPKSDCTDSYRKYTAPRCPFMCGLC